MATLVRDNPGAAWEKRGNALWAECGRCHTWFPVSVVLTRPEAPDACCPRCQHRFSIRPAPSTSGSL